MSDYTLPMASGIYKITCTANKRIYIGSAVSLYQRKQSHFNALRRNKHGNLKLQRAYNKYGDDTFIFEVLELVLPMSLTAREQYWLNKLKPFGRKGFNILKEAGSPLGRKHAPKTIEKMRQSGLGHKRNLGRKQSPEWVEKRIQSHRGRKRPSETGEKIRLKRIGKTSWNKGRKHTPEFIEKLRQSAISRDKDRKRDQYGRYI